MKCAVGTLYTAYLGFAPLQPWPSRLHVASKNLPMRSHLGSSTSFAKGSFEKRRFQRFTRLKIVSWAREGLELCDEAAAAQMDTP